MVFDKAITFIRCPKDKEWTVLCDDFLWPEKYVDAVFTYGYSSTDRNAFMRSLNLAATCVFGSRPFGVSHGVI